MSALILVENVLEAPSHSLKEKLKLLETLLIKTKKSLSLWLTCTQMATLGFTLTTVDKQTISKKETLACFKSSKRLLMMRSSQLTMTIRGILNPLLATKLVETWMIGSLQPITFQQ